MLTGYHENDLSKNENDDVTRKSDRESELERVGELEKIAKINQISLTWIIDNIKLPKYHK